MEYLTTEFIKKSKAIHGDNYGYSKVIYTKSNQDVIITCTTHGDFNQRPSNHLIGRGCYKCGRKIVSDKKQLNETIFIERAILIHGNKYDYSMFVYVDTSTPGIIICPIINHGQFLQTPNKHLNRKDGCKKCGRISNGIKHRSTKDEFIEKSKLIHGDNFDYSKVEYVNNSTDVTIYCKKCEDDFQQTPATHLRGSICPNCANKLNGDKCRSTKDEFIEKSKLIHGDNFDYSKVEYITARIKIIIYCKKCKNDFPQTPDKHLQGYGCPFCVNKTEGKLYKKLLPLYKSLITQFKQDWCKKLSYLPFDFCIPEYKIIIELDGRQHFQQVSNWSSPKEQYENDKYKEKCANDNGYSVIRILQEDVFYDTYDWVKELCESIEELKNGDKIANIYLCKNGEYDNY